MKHLLRLYITGRSVRSLHALANLKALCEDELKDRFDIDVIDILEHPELAEDEKILATPTLVKRLPHPFRKIIGDLSEKEKVLLGLDLVPHAGATKKGGD